MAAEELAGTGRRALGLPTQEMDMRLDEMSWDLKNLMTSSPEFLHVALAKFIAGNMAQNEIEENHGEATVHKQPEENVEESTVQIRGGGNKDASQMESSTAGSETTFSELTLANYMTMVRLNDSLKTLLRMLKLYEDFKATCGGGFYVFFPL